MSWVAATTPTSIQVVVPAPIRQLNLKFQTAIFLETFKLARQAQLKFSWEIMQSMVRSTRLTPTTLYRMGLM